MTKNFNFALKIKGGGGSREGGTCKVLRPCPPKHQKIWNVHKMPYLPEQECFEVVI